MGVGSRAGAGLTESVKGLHPRGAGLFPEGILIEALIVEAIHCECRAGDMKELEIESREWSKHDKAMRPSKPIRGQLTHLRCTTLLTIQV